MVAERVDEDVIGIIPERAQTEGSLLTAEQALERALKEVERQKMEMARTGKGLVQGMHEAIVSHLTIDPKSGDLKADFSVTDEEGSQIHAVKGFGISYEHNIYDNDGNRQVEKGVQMHLDVTNLSDRKTTRFDYSAGIDGPNFNNTMRIEVGQSVLTVRGNTIAAPYLAFPSAPSPIVAGEKAVTAVSQFNRRAMIGNRITQEPSPIVPFTRRALPRPIPA